MPRKKAFTAPAPYVVELAEKAYGYGLTVLLGPPDPNDPDNGVTLVIEYEADERDEAHEIEDMAGEAWDEFEADNGDGDDD